MHFENENSIRNIINREALKRILPIIIITGFWCFLGSNLLVDIHDYLMMNITFIAILVVLSSFALRNDYENPRILGLVIGLGVYFGSIILSFSLPPPILLLYEALVALAVMNILGAAISLFYAVSLGLWLSNTRLDLDRKTVKYGAPFLTLIVVFGWIGVSAMSILGSESYSVTIPGIELLYYILFIVTSSIFIPRRRIITIFFFALGLVITLGGLLLLTRTSTLDSFLLGYYLQLFGGIFITLFALPLGASSISPKVHPESGLYIATTMWFFLEILLTGYMYPFSPIRVFAIAIIVILSMRTLKINQPLLLAYGMIISAFLSILGVAVIIDSRLSLSLTHAFAGLGLTITSTSLLVFTVLSVGELIRLKLEDNQTLLRGIGLALIFAGLVIGVSALSILAPFVFQLDIIFLILVGLGSMLLVIKPNRALYIAFVLGALSAASVVFSEFLYTVQIWYYSSMALMLFACIQQYRLGLDSTPVELPVELTEEPLIQ
jgi:hypothetical protein